MRNTFSFRVTLAVLMTASCATQTSATPADPRPVLEAYAAHLYTAYGDSLVDAQALSTAVEAFLASPSDASLKATREAWIASRAHYMLTEGARFYGGPIDAEPDNNEAALNSWPLDEGYIDYTTNKATGATDTSSGLVNHADVLPAIDFASIDALNTKGGDTNISVGYHAVEFLLWGQALDDIGPGKRPFSDYVPGGSAKNVDRRASYLRAAVRGIVTHLTNVRDAWAPSAAYRVKFVGGGKDSLALIFTGLGKFSKGELGGQRMDAPYATKARRDQHDCFSSLTLVDYERDARGVLGLYLGNYGATDGPGIDELVRAANPDIDARLRKQIQASIDSIVAIPPPFESAIVGDDASSGRKAVHAAVTSLRAQGDLFAEAASALGLNLRFADTNP